VHLGREAIPAQHVTLHINQSLENQRKNKGVEHRGRKKPGEALNPNSC